MPISNIQYPISNIQTKKCKNFLVFRYACPPNGFGRRIFFIFYFLFFIFGFSSSFGVAPTVRIKDIAHVLEARENQLMGFGLVVGLQNTGDRSQTGFTQQALNNLLSRLGIVPQGIDFKSKNVAAVMVTTTLPPFVKPGQKIDVTVSSVGDATSLQGGTLLVTPLQGVDDQVYAVAQGNILVGVEPTAPTIPYVRYRQATSGRIPSGAFVEKEVPVALEGKDRITIVLDDPDFTTASRVVTAIMEEGIPASAKDAGTVIVPLTAGEEIVDLVSRVENLAVTPDVIAKIVVNEKTGTIVMGENVKIAPVAVAHGGVEVKIGDLNLYSYGTTDNLLPEETRYWAATQANLEKKEGKLSLVSGATLADLVKALNAIGASAKDMIAIFEAMKKVGAIKAELEVI